MRLRNESVFDFERTLEGLGKSERVWTLIHTRLKEPVGKSISVSLCDLRASVVNVFQSNFTTETEIALRHREEPSSDRLLKPGVNEIDHNSSNITSST